MQKTNHKTCFFKNSAELRKAAPYFRGKEWVYEITHSNTLESCRPNIQKEAYVILMYYNRIGNAAKGRLAI